MSAITKDILRTCLSQGIDELEDAFFDSLQSTIPDERERTIQAEELTNQFEDDIQTGKRDLPNRMADIILEDHSKIETGNNYKEIKDALLVVIEESEGEGLEGEGGSRVGQQFLTFGQKDTKPKLDNAKVYNFLEEKYKFFKGSETKRLVKDKVLVALIKKLKSTITGKIISTNVKNTKDSIEGSVGTNPNLKEILSKFKFNNRKATKINSIGMNINPSKIIPISDYTTAEYKNMKKEITEYYKEYANNNEKQHLSSLLKKIDIMLKPVDSIKVIEMGIDGLIGKLSLEKTKNRMAIYDFWKERYTEEEELKDAAKEFYEASKELINNKDFSINEDLEEVLEQSFPIYKNTFEQSKFSFIYKIDTTNAIYRKKMQVKAIEDEDAAALKILYDFTRLEFNDKVIIDDVFAGMTQEMIDESINSGENQTTDVTPQGTKNDKGQVTIGASRNENINSERTDDTFSEINDLTSNILEGVLDPLFYYALDTTDLFNNMGLLEKNFKRVKNAVRYYSKVTLSDGDVMFDLLEKYLDRIQDELMLTNESTNLFLPITSKLVKLFNKVEIEVQDNDKDILKYLQSIEKVVNFGEDLLVTRPPITVQGDSINPSGAPIMNFANMQEARTDGIDLSKIEITTWTTAFKDLIEKINTYYIIPSNSRFMPFNDEPKFSRWAETRLLGTNRDEEVADSLATLFLLEYAHSGSLVGLEQITIIKDNLKIWNEADTGTRLQDIVNAANSLLKVTVSIFIEEKDVSKDAIIELGAALEYIKKRNKIDQPLIFKGKPTSHWLKQYEEKKNYTWPFNNLVNHFWRLKDQYYNLPDIEIKARELFGVFSDMKIIKSETELKILDAHDMIRKLVNKPIYFGVCKTNNFEQVNNVLTILKSEHNVELTPFELESIVEEQDAHRNLSVKHGVSTDVVYYIKGNFR
tara:strand:- start:5358 stop:8126 length:2769 start_codon:yes stop_codon:yes gene_type:complete